MRNWRDVLDIYEFNGLKYVSLNALGRLVGYDPKTNTPANKFQRWLKKRGFDVHSIQAWINSKKVNCLAIRIEDVEKVLEIRVSQKSLNPSLTQNNKPESIYFYVLQLFHKAAPQIIVMGITSSLEERVRHYQSFEKVLLRKYIIPSRTHERTLIEMMCSGKEFIGTEVVKVPEAELQNFLLHCDKIVSLLPLSSQIKDEAPNLERGDNVA